MFAELNIGPEKRAYRLLFLNCRLIGKVGTIATNYQNGWIIPGGTGTLACALFVGRPLALRVIWLRQEQSQPSLSVVRSNTEPAVAAEKASRWLA
jgi:hypothetical protein